jgi:signal transduction histidine kinase
MKPDAARATLPDLARRLRLKESLLEAHANASCAGLIAISGEGDVWHVNRRFRQMWNLHTGEGTPRCDAEVWPGVLKQLHEPKLFLDAIAMLTSNPQRVCEWQMPTRAGRTIDCISTPITDEYGSTGGRLWAFRDVSETQRLQEELHRTRRLASVGQFSCSIAHDFRNLLVAVAGFSQMLAATLPERDAGQPHVREILRAAQHGRSLVEHLLAFANGRQSGQQLLSIGAVLLDTLAMLRVAARSSVELRTEVQSNLPLVLADAVGIQQVLINLVVNAAQAIQRPDGRIEIRVTPHQRVDATHANRGDSEQRSFVRLTVQDNGIGMPPEVLDRAFEPFYSFGAADGRGTGLGLTIVKDIVASHGGFISVDSGVGEGATFHIDFPVALTAPRQDA